MPARIARVAGLAVAVAAVAGAASPGSSPASGGAVLALDGPAAKLLRAQGVKVVPKRPARGGARRVGMPVGGSLAGSRSALVRQRGSLLLRRGKPRLRLRELELRLGGRGRVEAKLGGREIVLFRVTGGGYRRVSPATGRIVLKNLRLKLTGKARRLIAKRLGLRDDRRVARRMTRRPFGRLTVRVPAGRGGGGGTTTGGGTGGAPGGATGGAGGGGSGGGSQPIGCPSPGGAGPAAESPPPIKPRPLGAVDIVGATLEWHVRESFVRYIGAGEGIGASGGASPDPPVVLPGSSAALSYDFHFPFADGWLDRGADPGDPGDDAGVVRYSGALRFLYGAHEIDLTTADPEIEIDGGSSRAVFSISEGGGPTVREVLFNLDLSRARAIVAEGGGYRYEGVPGAVPAGTASTTFAGFYAPGAEFGCVNLTLTTG